MVSIKELIAQAGGAELVSDATGQTVSAVHKWAKNGIPERHWSVLRALGGMTVEELHSANQALRARTAGSPPVNAA